MVRKLTLLFFLLAAARLVSADVIVLDSGKTMKAISYAVEGSTIRVLLSDRAEMVIPVDWVKAIRIDPEPQPEPQVAEVQQAPIPDLAYGELILSTSRKHEMDWKLVAAVMGAESNFNPRAVSSKGALGLMQLMPETARLYQVTDPYDPAQNVDAGVRYLKMLIGRYQGNLNLALAAYNSGEKTVDKYRGIPPFSETRNYVRRVLQLLQAFSS
ncbi:MAG TPA: lytic transglycosylase domain-containing protein [Acidobacteriota bacterium]|nr:lytic transglycosylase domain-containing protein [Acidobacteriota bacterium]